MADKKIKTYKTVKKLVDAYGNGDLSARKHKPTFDLDVEGLGDVCVDIGPDTVFRMSVGGFIAQLAKLGNVKLPLLQD